MVFYVLVSYPAASEDTDRRPYTCIGEIRASAHFEAWRQLIKKVTETVPGVTIINDDFSEPWTHLVLTNGVIVKLDAQPPQGVGHWIKQACQYNQ